MENYFNYFTEIEEHFWKKRGTAMLLSTLDWALIDSWKQSDVPLEAILKGIDRTFEKYEARRKQLRKVNSLAYCHQEILAAASEKDRAALHHPSAPEPFPREELTKFLEGNARAIDQTAAQFEAKGRAESAGNFRSVAASLREQAGVAASDASLDLEDLERRMTVLEDKVHAMLLQCADEEALVAIRAEMDRGLAPFRRNMSQDQVALLEKQFINRKLLENAGLKRLSLFYL